MKKTPNKIGDYLVLTNSEGNPLYIKDEVVTVIQPWLDGLSRLSMFGCDHSVFVKESPIQIINQIEDEE